MLPLSSQLMAAMLSQLAVGHQDDRSAKYCHRDWRASRIGPARGLGAEHIVMCHMRQYEMPSQR